MTLSTEERTRLDQDGVIPIVVDGLECILVRTEVYDRVRTALESSDGHAFVEQTYGAVLDAWDAAGDPRDAEDYRA